MKLNWKNKLHSGALQFTIFIAVIIALLLAGIILLASTHKYFVEQSKAIVDNIQLADTGIEVLLKQELIISDTLEVPLLDSRENQTINVHLSNWGVFQKAYVKTRHRKKEFIKCSLLGANLKSIDRPAIYLNETHNPLAVVGNTRIEGDAILPEQGIRSGNISGNSYYGTQLIYGKVSKSNPELPKLRYDYKQQLQYYLNQYEPSNSNNFIALGKKNKIVNSFKDPVKGYFSTSPIILENVSIYGNIIIRSTEKIVVKKTANLKDIILVAPIIVIEDYVNGNFQAIADTSIKIGANCLLSYPSALVILEKENSTSLSPDEFNKKIFVDADSEIKGSICYFKTQNQGRDFKTNIFIGNRSLVKGEIYCEGNLELKDCTVEGTVYTKYFVSNEGHTTFVNHLYNTTINSNKLPEVYGGILFDNQSKSVMKWLY